MIGEPPQDDKEPAASQPQTAQAKVAARR